MSRRRGITCASLLGTALALPALVLAGSIQAAGPPTVKAAQTCKGEPATIVGKQGRDRKLKGTTGRDVIAARGGDDFVDGRGGNDIICGGSGDDFMIGGSGDDDLYGDPGNDVLLGQGGDDRLFGQDGDDQLNGQENQDLCSGGSGDDLAVEDDCERIKGARGI